MTATTAYYNYDYDGCYDYYDYYHNYYCFCFAIVVVIPTLGHQSFRKADKNKMERGEYSCEYRQKGGDPRDLRESPDRGGGPWGEAVGNQVGERGWHQATGDLWHHSVKTRGF